MHLLHLGAHCLNAAQDLVLVRDGSDSDPCQVTVKSKRRSRELENCGSDAGAVKNIESTASNIAKARQMYRNV